MIPVSSSWYIDRNGIVIESGDRPAAGTQRCVGCGDLYVPTSKRTTNRVQRYCGLSCWGRSRTGRNSPSEAQP